MYSLQLRLFTWTTDLVLGYLVDRIRVMFQVTKDGSRSFSFAFKWYILHEHVFQK